MKRVWKAFSYLFLSVVLFFGGVSLEVSPAKVVNQIKQDADDILPDDVPPDGGEDAADSAVDAEDKGKKKEQKKNDNTPYRYYYSIMDAKKKSQYTILEDAVAQMKDAVLIPDIVSDEVEALYLQVYYDHPEFFWMNNSYSYRMSGNGVEIVFEYTCTAKEKEKREAVINRQVQEILAGMPTDSGEYEQIKYVFETLVNMTDYNLDAPDNQNIYSVFGNWESVCAGYARATQHLLNQVGIECIYVVGEAGENHAWNIVKCEGKYYYVDTTWGDPVYQELQGTEEQYKRMAYEYLCCPEELLFRTHTPDDMLNLPVCEDNSLEYYRLADRYFETYDRNQIAELLKEAYLQGEKHTEFQYSDESLYDQAHADFNAAFDEAVAQVHKETGQDASKIHCMYGGNRTTAVFTVDWK